jgi:hypothetical protein
MPRLERIHLADLWPSSVEPIRLYASFDGVGDLLTAQAPDLELEWMRYPDEPAEKFSRRICNDLLAARGRPPLPGHADLAKPIPTAPPSHYHKDEVGTRGSKLIEEGFKEQPRPHKPRPHVYNTAKRRRAFAE